MNVKLFLTFCILNSACCISNAQTNVYHPFPDSNAIWNIHFGLYCFMNGTGNEDYSIIISGDTLINSQTYHKLETPYVLSYSTGTCGGLPAGYKGAIRQDTTNRKVFFVPPTDTTEQLLYDFTMQVGDTVKGYTETNAFPTDIVQYIDSVLVGSTYNKRWNINTCYNIYFIEGVGSTYGLIERSPGCLTDMSDYSITCFQQNGQTLYPDTIKNCQPILTSVNSIDNYFIRVNIFPNPFSTQTTFHTGNLLNNATLTVDNYLSQTVKQIKNISGQTVTLSRDNLPSRLYFIRLKEGGKAIATKKLLITD